MFETKVGDISAPT